MKILVLQAYDQKIINYTKYSVAINSAYCLKHGYTYTVESGSEKEGYSPHWYKIFLAIKYARTLLYEYIVFFDSDIAVLNHEISLESKIKEMKGRIAFCANGRLGGDYINSGSFIMACGKAEIEFFEDVIFVANNEFPEYKLNNWHEQSVINKIYSHEKYTGLIDVFELDFLNSYYNVDFYNQQVIDNQFVFHFCNRNLQGKNEISRELFISRLQELYGNIDKKTLVLLQFANKWQAIGHSTSQHNFVKTNLREKEWRETNSELSVYIWQEDLISDRYIQLIDNARNIKLRLFVDHCEISINDQPYKFYLKGNWCE